MSENIIEKVSGNASSEVVKTLTQEVKKLAITPPTICGVHDIKPRLFSIGYYWGYAGIEPQEVMFSTPENDREEQAFSNVWAGYNAGKENLKKEDFRIGVVNKIVFGLGVGAGLGAVFKIFSWWKGK